MAQRAITFNKMNGFLADAFNAKLHDLDTDVFSMRIVTDVVAVSDATNLAFTEVTGNNYTAGGIVMATNVDIGANGELTLESTTDLKWLEDAAGWPDGNSAIVVNDTSGRIVSVADIRDGASAVSSVAQDVDINLPNVNGSANPDLLYIA